MTFSRKKITVAYTVEKCPKCQTVKRREFSQKDVLFSESSKCLSCGGMMVIEKIYGQILEQ